MLSNAVCTKHQKVDNTELLHYLKDRGFNETKLTSLFSWNLLTRWKKRMMDWWHKIQGKPFLGEFKEDSRRSF